MSTASRNFLIAYFCLVILPITGLLGILKHSRNLVAPISIGGTWKIIADPGPLAGIPCVKSLASLQDASITVSQSGKDLTIALPSSFRNNSSGRLDGSILTASF